ncbi:MAG: hypothetical protein KGL39_12240 [Patescibacteria group bacterium]|nr:hypothetical protein [Patescibacteria group bacterium]
MTEATDEQTYRLVVSFPDQSASFVHGFEAGRIDEQMRGGHVTEIEVTTHTENREVLTRMAVAVGWDIECKSSGTSGWDFTKLVKTKPAPVRPNPHGLRAVK